MDKLQGFGSLESAAVLGLCAVLGEAYSAGILKFWYISIDIHFILCHVEFDGGLSISVLKNKATRHKNPPLEIVKFQTKRQMCQRLPLIVFPTPPFSNSQSVKTWYTAAFLKE
jgi:hypothetical protein